MSRGKVTQLEVVHLDDEGVESGSAALRVGFAPSEIGHLTGREGNALAVFGSYPTASLEADEELAKPRDVWTDLATRRNSNEVDVRGAGSNGYLDCGSVATLKLYDGDCWTRRRTEDDHRPTLERLVATTRRRDA